MPSGTAGLERGDRCGGGRRQRWPRQFRGHQRLRNHRRPRQQPLCHHGRRDEHHGHAFARRRQNHQLQFEGPDLVRPCREARSGGAGESHYFGGGLHRSVPRNHLSPKRRSEVAVPGRWGERHKLVLPVERHQHGRTHGERRGGFTGAEEPQAYARPGKGHSDEDGFQVRTDQQREHGPGDRDFLHQPERHLHRGRRLSRYPGCARE